MKSDCKPRLLLSEERAEAYVPLSALQHYLYCPRQCGLIHLEQAWAENLFTAEGKILHGRADSGQSQTRGPVRTETGVWLRSEALGLAGKADVVEFHCQGRLWAPFPVEFKRGRSKTNNADRVQLCGQCRLGDTGRNPQRVARRHKRRKPSKNRVFCWALFTAL